MSLEYHDFAERLQFSETGSMQAFWIKAYERAFPDMCDWRYCDDLQMQKNGVDRIVYLETQRAPIPVYIDEKVRETAYPDVLLEFTSNDITGSPGWIEKPLQMDYLAYGVLPTRQVYLFPWPQLRRAWMRHGEVWKKKYRIIKAKNGHRNGARWNTLSVAIPTKTLFVAVVNALAVDVPT